MSEHLFPLGGGTFGGAAGNIVFNGQQFVTPVVQSNGTIRLTFLDTNGVAVSNVSLSMTGSGPRLTLNEDGYLLAWLNTNVAPSELNCVRVSGGGIGVVSTIGTNVERFSFSGTSAPFLTVWQSSSTAVLARTVDSNGAPLAPAFAVAPSARPQLYPSVGTDGTNHLVCWIEQNVASNDWRVAARIVANGLPAGLAVTVSETNSLRPYPTACTFGTNYLVTWSWDEGPRGPYDHYIPDPPYRIPTNFWFPMVHGRMLSVSGLPENNAFVIARNSFANTNPAVAFGAGAFLVAWANAINWPADGSSLISQQRVQRLMANGARWSYPIPTVAAEGAFSEPHVAFGNARFCVLYPLTNGVTQYRVFGPSFMPDMRLVNLRRTTNGAIAADSLSGWPLIETSSDLVNWHGWRLSDLPALTNQSRLFVRLINGDWQCIEQLRSLDWAKQRWAFEENRNKNDAPTDNDLFGATHYLTDKPYCPHNGTYILGTVEAKPACTLSFTGHTL